MSLRNEFKCVTLSYASSFLAMPVNRNALIRFKTIDQCLQNRFRKWTLEDLIDACSEALYEYEGIDKGISKRTIQGDLQLMRSDKLGYNAPIIVIDKKYYAYEDSQYSITNIPLSNQDLVRLHEAVGFLKQFKGFSHFRELDTMVQKLEDQLYSRKHHRAPVIDFEKNDNLKGLEYLDVLHKAILNRVPVFMSYQSFNARSASSFVFHPYLLKEFRNRWFILGVKNKETGILNLALDRIVALEKSDQPYILPIDFDPESYFKHTIGVSVIPNQHPEPVVLYVLQKHAPYVLTKPLHWSQKLIERDNYGMTISLEVQHNFELEKDILAFGDGIKVVGPERLRRNIKDRLRAGLDLYQTELSEKGLNSISKKLEYRGYTLLKYIYSTREIQKIVRFLDSRLTKKEKAYCKRALLQNLPELTELLLNKNLKRIIHSIDSRAFLTKAIYFNKEQDSNRYVTWRQNVPIHVSQKKTVRGFSGWTEKEGILSVCPPDEILHATFSIRIHLDETDERNGALKILPGSHKKRMSEAEIRTITGNSLPLVCDVMAGGIQIMRPLLLHTSSNSTSQKKRRVIHLDFCSQNLPEGLEWSEQIHLNPDC